MGDEVINVEDSGPDLGGFKAYLVCVTAALFFFYEFIQMHMFDAINHELREAFSVNATSLGLLSSSYLWADLLFLIPAGLLLDRFSVKRTVIAALWLCIFGTVGFALSYHFWMAAFFHFLTGIGNAFCFLACVMLVSRWFPHRKQGMMIGVVITMAFLGGVAAQAPLAGLSQALGWRQALMADALLGTIILWLIYLFVEDAPRRLSATIRHLSLREELCLAMANRQNYLAGVYTSLLNLPIMVLCALWGMPYLQKVHALNEIAATQVVTMIFIGSIIGSPLVGFISDKMGERRKPMLIGGLLTVLLTLFLPITSHLPYALLLLLFFLIGLVSSTQVIAYPMVAESNPPETTGSATAIASCLIMAGAAVTQVIFGKLLDWHWVGTVMHGQRWYSVSDYQFAMLLFPVTALIALIAMYFTYDPLKPQDEVEDSSSRASLSVEAN